MSKFTVTIRVIISTCVLLSCLAIFSANNLSIYKNQEVKYQGYKHPSLELGDHYVNLGKRDSAVYYYKIAAESFKKEENWIGYLKSLNNISDQLRRLSKFSDMQEYLIAAKDLGYGRLDPEHPEFGFTYFYAGYYYQGKSDLHQSLAEFNRAVDLFKKGFGESSPYVADAYYAIGFLSNRGFKDFYNAKENFNEAMLIRENQPEPNRSQLGATYFMIASNLRDLKDFEKALYYSQQSLQEYLKAEPVPFLGFNYALIGNMYLEMKDYNNVIANYNKAVELMLNAGMENTSWMAVFYLNLCLAYVNLDQPDKAIELGNNGLKILNQIEPKNLDTEAFIYDNLGIAYTVKGEYEKGMKQYTKALRLLTTYHAQSKDIISETYGYMGDSYRKRNQVDSAIACYQSSLIAGVDGFSDRNPRSIPRFSQMDENSALYFTLEKKAALLSQKGIQSRNIAYLQSALNHYYLADSLITSNRQSFDLEGSQLFLLRNIKQIYKQALDCAYSLYQLTNDQKYLVNAHDFFEKSKSRILHDVILEAKKGSDLPDSVVTLQKQLEIDLRYNLQLQASLKAADSLDNQRISELQERIFQITRNKERLRQYLESNYPAFKSSGTGNEVVSLERTIGISAADSSQIIEFFWSDSVLFGMTVTPDKILFKRTILNDQIRDAFQKYSNQLRTTPANIFEEAVFKEFHNTAYYLYNEILAPFLLLNGPPNLIIIPDGYLSLIPFEALVMHEYNKNGVDYKALDYLINHYRIKYDYSVSILDQNQLLETNFRNPSVLALGYTSESDVESPNNPRDSLGELPGTLKEVEMIQRLIGNGKFLLGSSASKSIFKEQGSQFDILHLAIHGVGDESNILNSRLIFKQGEAGEDGNLYAYEMFNMNLKAQLAVLSACETGVGKLEEGEGIFNMARGFIYAGCPSLVMSLWKISDRTSAEIMEYFYESLKEGNRVDLALRDSQLSYLQKANNYNSHPAYWAAFVQYGNPVSFDVLNYTPYYIAGIVIVLAFSGWLVLRRRKTSS